MENVFSINVKEVNKMALINLTLQEFIQEVDSKKPAPGGGSVSALASLLGCSLARMVGHLTISKKSFEKLPAHIQTEFSLKMDALEIHKSSLLSLIDADTEAFNAMMLAYKLPKETESEKLERDKAIEEATIQGIKVPEQVVDHSLSVLEELPFFLEYGNASALSDVGVGILLLSSGLEGAILNMKINLPGIKNPSMRESFHHSINNSMQKKEIFVKTALEKIHKKLDHDCV